MTGAAYYVSVALRISDITTPSILLYNGYINLKIKLAPVDNGVSLFGFQTMRSGFLRTL
jgi:hypothetical protein